MNIFSGARRIAAVIAFLWVCGWTAAAVFHKVTVNARYDFVVGSEFANFAGFDLHSCPEKTYQRSLDIRTDSGRPIHVTLCVFGSAFNLPNGFVLEDPTVLVQNPFYKYADIETKRKLFMIHVAQHPSYKSANAATKKAIRERFGIPESEINSKDAVADSLDSKIANPFDPDKYLQKAFPIDNPFDIFDEDKIYAALKIGKEDQARLNDKWWELWRLSYGQGLAILLGGLATLWVFTFFVGWIVRGFLNIPAGVDSRPNGG
jgi:hypothetical protein